MDIDLRNESDLARVAMGMLPVVNESDLVNKMRPYKDASVSLLKELVRAVNKENQYHALKTAEFNIDKAADKLCSPFDPERIVLSLGKKEVGKLKAASVDSIVFKDIRNSLYTGKVTRKKAKKAAVKLAVMLKRAKLDSDKSKLGRLAIIAESKRASMFNGMKIIAKDIAELLGRDPLLYRKYATPFAKFSNKERLPIGLTADKVVKWAELNDRLQNHIKSLELIDFVLEDK